MPKQVDHDARREELARVAAGIVADHGLDALTFRELAARADASVAQIQHYFGTKTTLLVHTLNTQSAAVGLRIATRLEELGPHASARNRILALAETFLPTDDASRSAMIVYLSFGAGALTEPAFRSADAFARGEDLRTYLTEQFRSATSTGTAQVAPEVAATTVLGLILGLSLLTLLPGGESEHLLSSIDHYLTAAGLPAD